MPSPTMTDTEESEYFYNQFVRNSNKLQEISPKVWLHEYNGTYSIVKSDQILGFVKTSNNRYHNVNYRVIDLIYILKQYRNTNAIKWILYAISELSTELLLIDGSIFSGGQRVVQFMDRSPIFKLSILDKITGKVLPFDEDYSNLDWAILVQTGKLGFRDNKIVESEYYWLPWEEYLGDI